MNVPWYLLPRYRDKNMVDDRQKNGELIPVFLMATIEEEEDYIRRMMKKDEEND